MIVILNRDEIEEAIQAYVRDKLLPYGDARPIHVTQERKVTAKVTFGEETVEMTEPFPMMMDLDEHEELTDEQEAAVAEQPSMDDVEEAMATPANILPV